MKCVRPPFPPGRIRIRFVQLPGVIPAPGRPAVEHLVKLSAGEEEKVEITVPERPVPPEAIEAIWVPGGGAVFLHRHPRVPCGGKTARIICAFWPRAAT